MNIVIETGRLTSAHAEKEARANGMTTVDGLPFPIEE